MTIPAAPQIGSTGLIQQPGIGQQVAPLIEALTQRRLADAQVESYASLTAQRRQEAARMAREAQDQADAARAFYDHVSGLAVRTKPEKPGKDGLPPSQGVDPTSGMLTPLPQFERGLSPQAHALYMQMIASHNDAIKQGLEGVRTQVGTEHDRALTALAMAQNDATVRAAADEAATRRILANYGPRLQTEAGQRGAIGEVMQAAGPDAADKVARALNVGVGRYGHVVGPDGYLYITDSKTGAVRRDTTVGTRANTIGQERLDAIRRAASTVRDLMDEQTAIIQTSGLAGSKNPTLAQMAETGRVLGISTEAVANIFRSDPQQLTQMLRTRFAHNYIGLLANARSSGQILENLTRSYWAAPNASEATLLRAEQDRRKLRQIMDDVASGRITDMSRIPGFAESAAAAAAEGQVPQGANASPTPPNPDDYLRPIP